MEERVKICAVSCNAILYSTMEYTIMIFHLSLIFLTAVNKLSSIQYI